MLEVHVTGTDGMCSKVSRQDGNMQWAMKSLAGQASPYRICDSISLQCLLKLVQPVVLESG